MHPAASVIVFTVASGAGYGLLFLLGVGGAGGWLPPERWFGVTSFALSLGAITFGLLSSTFHLGHPERAWRAVSQWRSSWLSREGLASLIAYAPATIFAVGWIILGRNSGAWGLFGLIAAAWAAITVYCTAMIYASLKPIQRWHNGYVVPCYLLLAMMTGAVWLNAVAHLFGRSSDALTLIVIAALAVAWPVKLAYWRFIDRSRSESTAETATGLGHLGKVRLLDAPHTEDNYLMQEMGFRIARKHAYRLRAFATIFAFVLPFLLTALTIAFVQPVAGLAAVLAAVFVTTGVLIERWLFFAEAKHAVTLYYGQGTA
jgi:sulfite dehydrogenase (quinone) subunit SoeC